MGYSDAMPLKPYEFLKHHIKKFDNRWLRSRLSKWRTKQIESRLINSLQEQAQNSISIYYDKDTESLLLQLCSLYGSDKGGHSQTENPWPWAPHNYTEFYSTLFDHCRESIYKVFECGIGTNNPKLISTMGEKGKPGASLRVWRDYFPNASIYGADVDRDILFSEESIATFYLDQTDVASIKNCWNEIAEYDFDLIIDDGLHTFEAGTNLFSNSIERLSEYGLYVIEDVYGALTGPYWSFFRNLPYSVQIVNFNSPTRANFSEGLVVIQKLRKPKSLASSRK
jgi:hypothetical protein